MKTEIGEEERKFVSGNEKPSHLMLTQRDSSVALAMFQFGVGFVYLLSLLDETNRISICNNYHLSISVTF